MCSSLWAVSAAALMPAARPTSQELPVSQPVASVSLKTRYGWVHGVKADLSSGRITAKVVLSPRLASPRDLISKTNPVAALTGSFFSWESQKPVAEVLLEGQLAAGGKRGSILAFRWTGEPEVRDAPFGATFDWSPYRFGLRGGVRLMTDGRITPNPRAQKFRDPAIWGRAARTGAGVTKSGKLILAATARPMTLSQFGEGMKALGAVNAVSLDGGGSTMLFHQGRMIVPTQRRLVSLVTLHFEPPFDPASSPDGLRAGLSRGTYSP